MSNIPPGQLGESREEQPVIQEEVELDKKADLVEEEKGLELQAEHQVCGEDTWPL